MFCPMCGAELEREDQKYCQNCGSEIVTPSEESLVSEETEGSTGEIKEEPPKDTTIEELSTPPQESDIKTKDYSIDMPKEEGEPGEFSKKVLIYAIVSLAFFGVAMGFAGVRLFRRFVLGYGITQPILGIVFSSIALGLSITGLSFASSSRSYSKQAEKMEPKNTMEEVGSIFAIFGLILNIITIVIAAIGIIISAFSLIGIIFSGGFFPF